MALTAYAPRVPAHPTRTGAHRSTDLIRLLVIHTSEGGETGTSAEGLAGFIASPASGGNVASYHYIADHDRVIPIVPDNYVAYANAGANHDGLAICYPGKAGQTAAQWADESSTAQHERVARWLADKATEYGVPLRKLSWQEIVAGARGVCGHWDVTLAYKRSTHTDPGPAYPWSQVLGRANELAAPPDEGDDDMPTAQEVAQAVWHEVVPNQITGQPDEAWALLSAAHGEAYRAGVAAGQGASNAAEAAAGVAALHYYELTAAGYVDQPDRPAVFWNGVRDVVRGEVRAVLREAGLIP